MCNTQHDHNDRIRCSEGRCQLSLSLQHLGAHRCSNLDSRLPPNREAEPGEAVEAPPDVLRCGVEPADRTRQSFPLELEDGRTYDSANAPNECGINRGALKRTVEHVTWYIQRPMANARFPGGTLRASISVGSPSPSSTKCCLKCGNSPGSPKHSSAAAHMPPASAA